MTTENVPQVLSSSAGRATDAACPAYHSAIELIGRRWNGVILRRLSAGPARFSELKASIEGITDTMLTQRLRELEDAAVVDRQVASTRPVDIRYSLTAVGSALSPILDAVADWSNDWAVHAAGG